MWTADVSSRWGTADLEESVWDRRCAAVGGGQQMWSSRKGKEDVKE